MNRQTHFCGPCMYQLEVPVQREHCKRYAVDYVGRTTSPLLLFESPCDLTCSAYNAPKSRMRKRRDVISETSSDLRFSDLVTRSPLTVARLITNSNRHTLWADQV